MSYPDSDFNRPAGEAGRAPRSAPVARGGVFSKLHTGTGGFDIVGRRKRWYVVFGLLVLVCIGSMAFRGFNEGIEFEGGTTIQFSAVGLSQPATVAQVENVVNQTLHLADVTVQTVGSGGSASVQITTGTLNAVQQEQIQQALFDYFHPRDEATGQASVDAISVSAVSASWGGEITTQALIALAVFLVLVTLFLAFYFERAMAVAALVALVHDLVVTAGVYSLVGFEVSPATVIGFLTILGYSLYDTVVVFDKVKENSRGLLGLTRRTYPETANLALNQTLMRSINTSLIALLPVVGLLVVGVGFLGVGTLADLALVQLVGLLAGSLSSIFLATPILVDLKMRDRRYRQQASRVAARRSKEQAGAEEGADVDPTDDEALDAELRRERAVAAASGVPARTAQRRAPGGSRAARPGRASTSRPSGKRRR
jgi:preprotein translocase subunit SecF